MPRNSSRHGITMKKYLIAAAAMCVLTAGPVLVWRLVRVPAQAAAKNLVAINNLTVGETTEVELLHRPAFQTALRLCNGRYCLYPMQAENRFLSSLHLARATRLYTLVEVRDGMVTGVTVLVWREGRPGLSLQQVSDMGSCISSPCLKEPITPDKRLRDTQIMFDHHSEIRNRMPQAVDTNCLSRLHDCETNIEWMPLLREISSQEGAR
jgi:hypothetical protein